MTKVIMNRHLGDQIYLLSVSYQGNCKMGQFFMVRAWEDAPLLSRPISIFDYNKDCLCFLYHVHGRGTKLLSKLKSGDDITLQGPYGNGFPYLKDEDITLIGGGLGIAPLYYAAKELNRINPSRRVNIYLGLKRKHEILDVFKTTFSNVTINVGGMVTDSVDFNKSSAIFTCGPQIMMEKVCQMGMSKNKKVYASIERRMACGVGACLGCTCKTKDGNKRTCKDGPVFTGEDLIYE